jgi:hypothetical protein
MRQLALTALCALLLTGCISYKAGGTRHYVVLGFGVVSVGTNAPTVTVVKSTIIGFGASALPSSKCTVGFANSVTVVASTNQNVIVEIGIK